MGYFRADPHAADAAPSESENVFLRQKIYVAGIPLLVKLVLLKYEREYYWKNILIVEYAWLKE